MRIKPTKAAGVFNLDTVTMLSNHVELLNKEIDGLYGSTQVHPVIRCDTNGGGVHTEYQSFNLSTEEIKGHNIPQAFNNHLTNRKKIKP